MGLRWQWVKYLYWVGLSEAEKWEPIVSHILGTPHMGVPSRLYPGKTRHFFRGLGQISKNGPSPSCKQVAVVRPSEGSRGTYPGKKWTPNIWELHLWWFQRFMLLNSSDLWQSAPFAPHPSRVNRHYTSFEFSDSVNMGKLQTGLYSAIILNY